MSIYNPQFPNDLFIRTKVTQSDDFLVLDKLTGEYVPLHGTSGEEITELPYYLKANAVTLDDGPGGHVTSLESKGVTFVAGQEHEKWGALDIQENRFKVNRIDNDVADVDLKANILNDRVDNITNVQLPAHEASIDQVDDKVTEINNIKLPAYEASIDQIDDKVQQNVARVNDLTVRVQPLETQVAINKSDIAALQVGQLSDPITFTNATRLLKMGSSEGVSYSARTGTLNAVTLASDLITCGTASTRTSLSPTSLSIFSGGVTNSLNTNSIKTANSIRDMVFTSSAPSSKMVVYNPTTKVFNNMDIPTSSSLSVVKLVKPELDSNGKVFRITADMTGPDTTPTPPPYLKITTSPGEKIVIGSGNIFNYNTWYGFYVTGVTGAEYPVYTMTLSHPGSASNIGGNGATAEYPYLVHRLISSNTGNPMCFCFYIKNTTTGTSASPFSIMFELHAPTITDLPVMSNQK